MNLSPLFNRCAEKPSVALAIVGSPGNGKTAMVEAWARVNNLPFVKLLASTMDETDVAGIMVPDKKTGSAKTLSPDWLQKLGERGVLFLDEFNCARKDVQDAFLTIIQSRHLPNGDKIPEGVIIIAAMNDADMCDNYQLSPAMKSRFIWTELKLSIASWLQYFTGITESDGDPAPSEYITFAEWHAKFISEPNFEADKKNLLREAVKLGLDFTPDDEIVDKDVATCPRSLSNLAYWANNAGEMVQWAEAFIAKDDVKILESVDVKSYQTVANSVFQNNRTQSNVNGEEDELLEKRKGILGAINQEVQDSYVK